MPPQHGSPGINMKLFSFELFVRVFFLLCLSFFMSSSQKHTTHTSQRLPNLDSPQKSSLEAVVRFVLYFLRDLQDSLLTFRPIRRLVLRALQPSCFQGFSSHIVRRSQLLHTFDDLKYYVDGDSRQLLLQSCYHSLTRRLPPVQQGNELPSLGRVLVFTNCPNSGEFQREVACATAKEVGADLVEVDLGLLDRILKESLGQGLESLKGEGESSWLGLLALCLSWFVSGGRLAFAWDVVQGFCGSLSGKVVLFMRDAERILGGFNGEAAEAFMAAFCSASGENEEETKIAHVIAGTSQREQGINRVSGADIPSISNNQADASGCSNPNPAGVEEEESMCLFDFSDLSLRGNSASCTELEALFPVQVRLRPPPQGPLSVQHWHQLMDDGQANTQKRNHRMAKRIGQGARLIVPKQSSKVYSYREPTESDWCKVLAWASHQELYLQNLSSTRGESATGVVPVDPSVGGEGFIPQGLQDAGQVYDQERNEQYATGLRNRRFAKSLSFSDSLRFTMEDLEEVKKQLLAQSAQMGESTADESTEMDNNGLFNALFQLLMLGPRIFFAALYWLVSSSGKGYGTLEHSTGNELSPWEPKNTDILLQAECNFIKLSEEAVWYGLKMLDRSKGHQAQVSTENSREKSLLVDVLDPKDLGSGFASVGALNKAKKALREAIELPLQHPEIFSRSSLISPPKGVLLFGPPGTGKTMLARAAAAEFNASFLSVSPSTVLSKWVGEGVKNVRAVFSLAAKLSPCVIFLDEVDALLGQRSAEEHESMRELKNEFMAQWDGIRSGAQGVVSRVMVLGATNRPQDIDEAVLRRFSRRIFCDLPDDKDIQSILDVMLAGEDLDPSVALEDIVKLLKGYSGSDLKQVCAAAAMRPIREYLESSQGKPDGLILKRGMIGSPEPMNTDRGLPDNVLPTVMLGEDSPKTSSDVRIQRLIIEDCKNIIASVGSSHRGVRQITLVDFEEACKEAVASNDADGCGLSMLRDWNRKWGDGAENQKESGKLTYFM